MIGGRLMSRLLWRNVYGRRPGRTGRSSSARSRTARALIVVMTTATAVPLVSAAAATDARPAAVEQVLVNPSFEEPGDNGAEPTSWTPVLLENENGPFNWAAVAYGSDGRFAPPEPIPHGDLALETFWQVGSNLGVMGMASEQTAATFGHVDQDGAGTLSYAAVQTVAPDPSVVSWAGAIAEVELASGGETYRLRYFHSNAGGYSGHPQDAADANVAYVIGDAFSGDDSWINASHDLSADVADEFGLGEFTVRAVRIGNLQDRTGTSPFSNMTTYWDNVRLEASTSEDTTPPAVTDDGLRPAEGATGVAASAPVRAGNPLSAPVSWTFTTAEATEPGELAQVHVMDVGQGDSIYVELPGDIDILVDCGWLSTVEDVTHYLDTRGVDDLDLLISTHPNADHMGGCGTLMDEFGVEHIIDSGLDNPGSGPDAAPLQDYLAARASAVAAGATYEVADFQRFDWDAASLEILGPVNANPGDANGSSVVSKLTVGDIDFMLTGDMGFDAESAVVARARQQGIDLDVEFLKVAHHGSRYSTGQPWLNAVQPEWGIVSVGENTYGHPHPDALGRLADAGTRVFRTDQAGDVVVATDGVSANVNGEPVLGEQLPYDPVPDRQPPEVDPPVLTDPAGEQVLANPSFEQPGQNGVRPTGWLPRYLDGENAPYRLDVVAYGADGRYPPPEPILDGSKALEVFWQTGDTVGRRIGVAAEQRSQQFDAVVDETGEVTFSYAAAQTFSANPDGADWGGGLAEVAFSSGEEQYTLRYFHPNADHYRGQIDATGTDTVKYVVAEPFPASHAWIAASHDIDADIERLFDLSEFTVDAVRVGNLQQRNTSWPYSQMATYWDAVRLHTTNPGEEEPIDPPDFFVPTPPISAGDRDTIAAKDGGAWTWGHTLHGDSKPATSRVTPGLGPDLTGIADVDTGSHALVLRDDGTVWGWGANSRGQLGNGDPVSRLRWPVQALGLDDMVAVDASAAVSNGFSMALRADGTVWTWGYGSSGQLGDGSSGALHSSAIPSKVPDLTGVVDIAAGASHSLALKEDGTVWAWGSNDYGQVGDGATQDRLEPTQVSELGDIVAVEASNGSSFALRADGTVWAWGANFVGQLGDGTTQHRALPTRVDGLDNVVRLSAFSGHVLASKTDGTVWAWGHNRYGQLGDGATQDRLQPVQMVGLSDITSVAAGTRHSVAVRQDGTVWAWGRNVDGQLGDGSTTDRHTPVRAEIDLGEQPVPDACLGGYSPDETVTFGGEDSGVPNVDRGDGCTVLDLVWAEAPFANHGQFVRHVSAVASEFRDAELITGRQRGAIVRAAARSRTAATPASSAATPAGSAAEPRDAEQVALNDQSAIHFIDVGQGDGAYIQLPGGVDIVVDCGRWTSGSRVRDYLISQQVDDVELLVATHPDADHIGGCDEIMQHYDVEQIVDNGMTAGTQTYQTYENARDAEVATGADYEGADFQQWDFGPIGFDLTAEFLKVAHHGSAGSTSTAWLDAVQPRFGIVSVGGNPYGHPT